MTPEIDEPIEQQNIGYEWDGIKELDTPVPLSIAIWMRARIAICVVLWPLYLRHPRRSWCWPTACG